MQTIIRPLAIGIVFAAIAAAGVTALTLRGETKEAGFVENACAKAAWPLIPAKCLEGSHGADVRIVDDQTGGEQALASPTPTMTERFATDFE
jgi:hypothetical protein